MYEGFTEGEYKLEGEEIIFGCWKCVECNSVNVGEMADDVMICADCDEEVIGIWKEYKGGVMTTYNRKMVKRLGLER